MPEIVARRSHRPLRLVVGSGDGGQPVVASNPDSPAAQAFVDVAGQVTGFLAAR